MLAASETTSQHTITDSKRHQRSSYDTFDSPFRSPSLFGSKPTNNEVLHQFKFDSFAIREEIERYSYQPSPPESFLSMMVDLESSGTLSPKEDCYKEDVYKLYNHHKSSVSPILHQTNTSTEFNMYPDSIHALHTDVIFENLESSSPEILRHRLQESTEMIQQLSRHVNVINMELEKKRIAITNFQSIVAGKDMEIQDLEQRLALANQLCDSQLINLNAKQNELNLYHSLVKQSEIASEENSENKKKLSKINEHSDTSKSLDTKRSHYCENNPVGRRWTDENSVSFNTERKHGYTAIDYRRILDKNVNTNWDLLVSRIIQDTDQQASLFLQQKLKSATLLQKEAIFKSILSQAYLLMTNRFGNFLVQRLFELGTPDQIQGLADKMKGNVLELTCEAFGCHVVQKALDYVTEPIKAKLVLELAVRISETITHRHACHVWQKVFEIRWSPGKSPNIMSNVHKALKNQWTHVALDETGSLVIQNIFENLTESDKRPVLDEVLKNIVTIAKGQWGNWVIQHILEQAEKKEDRELAFQTVLDEAIQLSMDQFASKVVEKALRIGGQQFLVKFIDRISTITCSHRPRMALIDIASDQYGNYVVQWLINNANDDQKVCICRLIKRHMVSLRGSKYGQRVAFLVEKVLRSYESPCYSLN